MKKSVIIYSHILFWVIIILPYFIVIPAYKDVTAPDLGRLLYNLKFFIPLFFYIGYVGIMMGKKRFISGLIATLLIVFTFLFFVSSKLFGLGVFALKSFLFWVTIGSLFYFFIDWFKKKNNVLVLEKETIKSNLLALRNQVNPHFLFNTLHNIDTLIHTDQKKASESLVKLSDMMRYMIKENQTEFVCLESEITYLENYFSLERLRLKNKKFFNYSIRGNSNQLKIAPMILISFVENAFKHSVDSDIENGIVVDIKIENKTLLFKCENHFNELDKEKDNSHGIGLDTVKQRLKLIYNNKHQLLINSEDAVFKVNLKLELDEN